MNKTIVVAILIFVVLNFSVQAANLDTRQEQKIQNIIEELESYSYSTLRPSNQQLNRSEEIIKQGLALDPNNLELLYRKALLEIDYERYESARATLIKLLALNPSYKRARKLLLKINAKIKFQSEEINLLTTQLNNDPTNLQVRLALIRALGNTTNYNYLLVLINAGLQQSPTNIELLYQKALVLINITQYSAAKEMLEKILTLDPDHEEANFLLKKTKELQHLAKQASFVFPQSSILHIQQSIPVPQYKVPTTPAPVIPKAPAILQHHQNPLDVEIRIHLISGLVEAKDYKAALAIVDAGIILFPMNTDLMYWRAVIFTNMEKYKDAADQLQVLLSLDAKNIVAENLLTKIFSLMPKAIPKRKIVIVTKPKPIAALALPELKPIAEPLPSTLDNLRSLEAQLRKDPSNLKWLYQKALIEIDLEKYIKAQRTILKVLAILKDNVELIKLLNTVNQIIHKNSEAIKQLTLVLKNNPKDIQARLKLIDAELVMDNQKEAMRVANEGLKLLPQNKEINYKKALLLIDAEYYQSATKLLKKILAQNPNNLEIKKLITKIAGLKNPLEPKIFAQKDQAKKPKPKKPKPKKPKPPLTLIQYINLLVDQKKYKDAMCLINLNLKLDKNNTELLYSKANLYLTQERYDKAKDTSKKILSVDPVNLKALKLLETIKKKDYYHISASNIIGFNNETTWVSDKRVPWTYRTYYYGVRSRFGSAFINLNRASRNGFHGYQTLATAYPVFNDRFSGYISYGYSKCAALFPKQFYAGELYSELPQNFQISLGGRYAKILLTELTTYTGSITKYINNYSISYRPLYFVPKLGPKSFLSVISLTRNFTIPSSYLSLILTFGHSPDLSDLTSINFFAIRVLGIGLYGQLPLGHGLFLQGGLGHSDEQFPKAFHLHRRKNLVFGGLTWKF